MTKDACEAKEICGTCQHFRKERRCHRPSLGEYFVVALNDDPACAEHQKEQDNE